MSETWDEKRLFNREYDLERIIRFQPVCQPRLGSFTELGKLEGPEVCSRYVEPSSKMKKPDPTEQALTDLREAGPSDLERFLRHRSARVIAVAAEKAVRLQAGSVTPELVDAFRRLLPGGPKSDPGCTAKLAIVKALVELDDPAAEVYFAGARHTQPEPVWGGSVDTAAEMRGICAIGLTRMAHPEGLLEAVRLLSDKCSETRIGALRALADSGKPDAELLLRFKADTGDREPSVMGECLSALLRLGPRSRAIPFVASFLAAGSEEAAIALGESRMPEAWPVLRDAFEGSKVQSSVLLGMSLLRNDEAIEFLLNQLERGRERVAAVVVDVLASYRSDDALRERVQKLVAARNIPPVTKAFNEAWN